MQDKVKQAQEEPERLIDERVRVFLLSNVVYVYYGYHISCYSAQGQYDILIRLKGGEEGDRLEFGHSGNEFELKGMAPLLRLCRYLKLFIVHEHHFVFLLRPNLN